jgi:Mrp family chromosome partitioning ATPase/capsular polysaccharide biosynthesis protein
MLRYSSSESVFLRDLIPENRALLSGASSAEILKSIPALVNTIREQDIRDEDIYKKPHEVLGGYLSGYLEDFFPSSLPPGLPGIDPKTLLLAKAFKDSLEESSFSSSSSSKKKPVEILEKSSQLPAGLKGDELITVVVESFNREKVAQMANGLASAFIDEYYRLSADDAHRSYEFLSELVDKAERDVRAAEKNQGAGKFIVLPLLSAGHADIARSSPLLENMSKELASLQNSLIKAEGIYAPSSEAVLLLRGQVDQGRKAMERQERIEGAKQVLEQLKLRRFQALNTENMYKNRLIPISVVEPAFTPKKSLSKVAVRYLIAGAVGLVLGVILALGLMVIFNVADPRLYTSWQIEKLLHLPIMAALPDLGKSALRQPLEAAKDSGLFMVNGLLQILGKMKHSTKEISGAKVVVITSASKAEGKTFLSLALSGALGQGGRHKILLIDANLHDTGISNLLNLSGTSGYVDAMIDGEGLEKRVVKNGYRGCDVLPAGNLEKIDALGFYGEELASNIEYLRKLYDFIIIDTAPILSSKEALICGMSADSVLIVVSAGHTRKVMVESAVQRLREVGVIPEGILINRKKEILPAFIYRNV